MHAHTHTRLAAHAHSYQGCGKRVHNYNLLITCMCLLTLTLIALLAQAPEIQQTKHVTSYPPWSLLRHIRFAIFNRTYSHLLLELRGEKALRWLMMDARKREVTDRVMHRVSFPHRPSIAISPFRGVRSRCRARGHAILLRENSKYVYIYICNVWNSGTESYKRYAPGKTRSVPIEEEIQTQRTTWKNSRFDRDT